MDNIYIFLIAAIVISLFIISCMIQTATDAVYISLKKQIAIELDKICRKQDEMYEELIWRIPEPKKDRLLYGVAKWAIECGHDLSTSAISRHFGINYWRAGKIVDQLYGMDLCSGSNGGTEPRKMLIDMDELMRLERAGAFKTHWEDIAKNFRFLVAKR